MTQTILSAGRVSPRATQASRQAQEAQTLSESQGARPLDAASSEASIASSPQSPQESARVAKMRDVASKFEAIFVRKMLEQGSKTAMAQGEGLGGEFYQSMYHGQVADLASQSNKGFGIARALLDSWGVEDASASENTPHDLLRARLEASGGEDR
jgi:Rod binding domain-containing protein